MAKLGIFVLTLAVELDGIEFRKWNSKQVIIFRRLSCNASNMLLMPKILTRKLMSESTQGIMERLKNSYVTPMLRL